jgi:heme O synthase-like polyprenyltransferase
VIYIFALHAAETHEHGNTAVGAIPGAIPPMVGWAAARGTIDPGAGPFCHSLLWQLPHFFAIA